MNTVKNLNMLMIFHDYFVDGKCKEINKIKKISRVDCVLEKFLNSGKVYTDTWS